MRGKRAQRRWEEMEASAEVGGRFPAREANTAEVEERGRELNGGGGGREGTWRTGNAQAHEHMRSARSSPIWLLSDLLQVAPRQPQ